jgi:hypothetical protein
MASGGPGVTIEARWGHQAELARAGVSRVGLVDPGSVTLGSLDENGIPMALDLGGHVRVGLEDYAGTRTPTNREPVGELAELIDASGRTVAAAEHTHQTLGMPDSR